MRKNEKRKKIFILISLINFCRFLFEFLMGQERNAAAEVITEYVDTMSKVYYSYFKSYDSRLMKLSVNNFLIKTFNIK